VRGTGGEKDAFRILVGKLDWKKPSGKLTCGEDDNIKMYRKGTGS
jgi:hypothetical protein